MRNLPILAICMSLLFFGTSCLEESGTKKQNSKSIAGQDDDSEDADLERQSSQKSSCLANLIDDEDSEDEEDNEDKKSNNKKSSTKNSKSDKSQDDDEESDEEDEENEEDEEDCKSDEDEEDDDEKEDEEDEKGKDESKDSESSTSGSLSFATDIEPIMKESCLGSGCHTSPGVASVDLDSYAEVKANFTDSLEAIEDGSMPIGRQDLSADQIKLLKDWEAAGFPE